MLKNLAQSFKGGAQVEPYSQEVITPIPTTVVVGGEQYILASQGRPAQNLPVPAAQQHNLQHQVPRSDVARINGVEHLRTAEGWRPLPSPYAPDPSQVPSWLKHPYTKGYGLLVAAAVMGVLTFIIGAALFAVVTLALANLVAIGTTILLIFVGGLVFMAFLTKARHGHAPSRGRY